MLQVLLAQNRYGSCESFGMSLLSVQQFRDPELIVVLVSGVSRVAPRCSFCYYEQSTPQSHSTCLIRASRLLIGLVMLARQKFGTG